jgi:hypothetical protein
MFFVDWSARARRLVLAVVAAAPLAGCCPPDILTEQLPIGYVGHPYEVQLEAECWGGTWWMSGELPAGMSFNSEGRLDGTPRYAGSYFITVTWEDVYEGEVVSSATRAYELVIAEKPPRQPD